MQVVEQIAKSQPSASDYVANQEQGRPTPEPRVEQARCFTVFGPPSTKSPFGNLSHSKTSVVAKVVANEPSSVEPSQQETAAQVTPEQAQVQTPIKVEAGPSIPETPTQPDEKPSRVDPCETLPSPVQSCIQVPKPSEMSQSPEEPNIKSKCPDDSNSQTSQEAPKRMTETIKSAVAVIDTALSQATQRSEPVEVLEPIPAPRHEPRTVSPVKTALQSNREPKEPDKKPQTLKHKSVVWPLRSMMMIALLRIAELTPSSKPSPVDKPPGIEEQYHAKAHGRNQAGVEQNQKTPSADQMMPSPRPDAKPPDNADLNEPAPSAQDRPPDDTAEDGRGHLPAPMFTYAKHRAIGGGV